MSSNQINKLLLFTWPSNFIDIALSTGWVKEGIQAWLTFSNIALLFHNRTKINCGILVYLTVDIHTYKCREMLCFEAFIDLYHYSWLCDWFVSFLISTVQSISSIINNVGYNLLMNKSGRSRSDQWGKMAVGLQAFTLD